MGAISEKEAREEFNQIKQSIKDLEARIPKADPRTHNSIYAQIEEQEERLKQIQKQSWHQEGSRLDQVIGLEEVRVVLKAAFVLPLRQPQIFKAKGGFVEPMQKIMLYGPLGTGKTLLAESAAIDSNAQFFPISLSELGSKYYYETDNQLRTRFKEAAACPSSLIFIDEVDSLGRKRTDNEQDFVRSVKTTLLQLIDKLPSNVKLIACTNYKKQLDSALSRRFDLKLYVHLPDEVARAALLKLFLSKPIVLSDDEICEVAAQLENFSGSDIQNLVRKAEQRNLKLWMACDKWMCDPLKEGKFVPWVPSQKKPHPDEESSIINLPLNTLGNPPPIKKLHLLGALSYVTPTSNIEEIIEDAPDYIKDPLKEKAQKLKENESIPSSEKIKILSKLAQELIYQPPEKIAVLTDYFKAAFPKGISEDFLTNFLNG